LVVRSLRLLLLVAGLSICFSGHALAMGSGPHPHVPYGLPAAVARGAANPAERPSMMTMVMSAASVIFGGILLFAIQPYVRRT